jgi:RNA polymerase sigma factor (sigma-70 family)
MQTLPDTAAANDIRDRTEVLLQQEADFIPNASFVASEAVADDAMLRTASQCERSDAECPRDLPPHLARLCESDLLTAEEERELFRAMNYLKYRVNMLRSQLDPASPDPELVEKAETLLRAANKIRDRIVRANMRLVMSIVKKFVTPQYSFDELLSDGIEILIQAVHKFDFDRGFRFSTYAYRAIARGAYRQVNTRQKDAGRYAGEIEEIATTHPEDSDTQPVNEASWHALREMLAEMLHRLDPRERYIVRRRYAMDTARKPETFQSMANKLGVSKERVRQLEQRAVGKLRKMAGEVGMAAMFA